MYPQNDDEYVVAYVDECGNFGTQFLSSGNSTHYILAAVVIPRGSVEAERVKMEKIREKHFKERELKSSNIAKNHPKRFQIIHEIQDINFKIVAVVVDKRLIRYDSSGLRFKKVYIKFLNNLLHKELKLLYPHLTIVADEQGSDEFMLEFAKYVEKDYQYSFLDSFLFEHKSSKKEPLIQLADFIAGTLSFGYEESKKCSEYRSFYKLLESKMKVIREWPINYENYEVNLNLIDCSKYDRDIATHCIRSVIKYIKDNEKESDPIIMDRIHVLQYLLNQIYIGESDRYFFSNELIKLLNTSGREQYNTHTFISQIIGPIRDNNVILSSSSNGYKIPINSEEIYAYANKTFNQVIPMLSRLKKARDRIMAITDNQLDIYDRNEYKTIKRLID